MSDEDQPYFAGMEPSQPPKPRRSHVESWKVDRHRFFFAFRPDKPVSDAISGTALQLGRQHGLAGRPVKYGNLHLSLFPFFEDNFVPADVAELASVMVQAIRGKPFEIVLDTAMSFRRKDGFCLVLCPTRGTAEIYNLHRQFVRRFAALGSAGSLTPHVTLLYTPKAIEKQPISPIRWAVREFALIHGYVGRHDVVARWLLR